MIDYSKFKKIDTNDISVRFDVYNRAIQILERFPRGSLGICNAILYACCELSYDGELSDADLLLIDDHRLTLKFYIPAYHMPVYREVWKYRPEGEAARTLWYPLSHRAIRLKRLRMAANAASKKINKSK